MPTYYRFEGQPISIIEALAYGLPIISTNYRGIPDMVINKNNGFLINPHSPIEIAEKISILFNDRNLCARMGEASKRIYHNNFSRDLNYRAFIDLFN